MKTQSRAIPRRFQSKLKLKEFFLGCLRRKGWKPFIKCQSKLDQTAPLILEPKPFKANHLLWALPASHSREVMARTKCPGSRWCPVNQSSNASSFLNHNSKTVAALESRKKNKQQQQWHMRKKALGLFRRKSALVINYSNCSFSSWPLVLPLTYY